MLIIHPLHLLRILWRERITWFWPIWIAMTLISASVAAWIVPQQKSTPVDSITARRFEWSRSATFAVIFLGLFLAFYVAGSLVWEDFTYYDNSHFTNGTLVGRDLPVEISPDEGRFFPLCYQEFNLIRHFTSSVIGYHALHIIQLVILCAILFYLDDNLSAEARVALIILALVMPSIVISFTGLIYGEWNVIFWLGCLVWSVKKFEQSGGTAWIVFAIVSAQVMLYYKETSFVLLLGFAFGRLVLRCWNTEHSGGVLKQLRTPESRLDLCLAALSGLFLLYYLAAMYPHFHKRYADDYGQPFSAVVLSYLKLDLLVWVFLAVGLARFIQILRRKAVPSLLWDGLSLAGMGCFSGYLFLGMYSAYYLAPVDLIAVFYLGHLAVPFIKTMDLKAKLWSGALLCLILAQALSLSAFRMYERKNVIHAKAELGQAILTRYKNDPQNVKQLYFPAAPPFQILEFVSYLNYLGVPIEHAPPGSVSSKVLISGHSIASDGPCGYRSFVCHPAKVAAPGDIVVVLPDDLTPTSGADPSLQAANPVFSYQAYPPIPTKLRPVVNSLHIVSPIFATEPLPDSWLAATVAVSK